jgi:hypothetical protein
MERKGSILGTIFLILLFTLLGTSLYFLYLNLPIAPKEFIKQDQNNNEDSSNLFYASSIQFYEKMRYKSNIITYKIESRCTEDKVNSVKEAFSILQKKTVLEFTPSSSKPEIIISCSNIAPDANQENHFVAGEGGPSVILNTSLYSVILEGKLALYRDENCPETKIALHELLHALGFDHNNNPKSILYPTLNCNQIIDQDIIDSINLLYSVRNNPDLKIDRVNATKSGRYLNFYIEVSNQGLKVADKVSLGIYEGEKLVEEFDLKEIEIGVKKTLDVENLKVSRSSNKISFIVDYQNSIQEIYEGNNKVELVLRE